MTEEQAKALKVGDKVLYIGDDYSFITSGKEYVVKGHDTDGDPFIIDNDGDEYNIYDEYCEEFKLVEKGGSSTQNYRIEIVDTGADFDESGMVRIAAYVNDELLAHLRDIEAEQGREAKRAKIREQIAKLEAELESLS